MKTLDQNLLTVFDRDMIRTCINSLILYGECRYLKENESYNPEIYPQYYDFSIAGKVLVLICTDNGKQVLEDLNINKYIEYFKTHILQLITKGQA